MSPLSRAATCAEATRRARASMLNGGAVQVLDGNGVVLHLESVPAPIGASRLFFVLQIATGALIAGSSALRISEQGRMGMGEQTISWIALVFGIVAVAVAVVMLIRRRS